MIKRRGNSPEAFTDLNIQLPIRFLGPEPPLLKKLNLETDPRSNIKAEHEKYTTSMKGIFAAVD